MGKWRLIQMDEAHGPVLANRSNVDLKVRRAHPEDFWQAMALHAIQPCNVADLCLHNLIKGPALC